MIEYNGRYVFFLQEKKPKAQYDAGAQTAIFKYYLRVTTHMSTKGNLELRIEKNTLYASCTHDGGKAYEIVPRLVDFMDSTENPTKDQFQEWFRKTSKELLHYNHHEGLIGGVPSEVIIDVPRRLLLHTHEEEFPASFENACIVLREKYNYQILEYVQPQMRKPQ